MGSPDYGLLGRDAVRLHQRGETTSYILLGQQLESSVDYRPTCSVPAPSTFPVFKSAVLTYSAFEHTPLSQASLS